MDGGAQVGLWVVPDVGHAAEAGGGPQCGACCRGIALPRGRAEHRGATRPFLRHLLLWQGLSAQAHQAWESPAASVRPTGVTAGGRWEARAPTAVSSNPTPHWSRRATASAPASLRLLRAAHRQR